MKRKSSPHHAAQGKTSTSIPSPAAPAPMTSAAAMARLPLPEDLVAGIALSPELAAAVSMDLIMGPHLAEAGIGTATVTQQLQAEGRAVAGGDLEHVRRTLTAQVALLDRMFHHLFQLAHIAGKQSHHLFERYLRLALKAQAQSAHTSAVIGRLCLEPVHRPKTPPQRSPEKAEAVAKPSSKPTATAAPSTATSPGNQPMPPRPLDRTGGDHGERTRAGGTLHGLSAPAGS